MLCYLVSTLAMALSALVIYSYFYRKGQFDDLEDVKYQMFREEEEP